MNHAHTRPSTTDTRLETDVVVVGARCAGATTAMLLARAGHDVIVVDRDRFPSDTLSTHAIARSGMVQLQRWGLVDEILASGAPEIREVVFHTPGGPIQRTIKESSGIDFLLAPRRTHLDRILADAAADAGARVSTGVTIDEVRRGDDGRVTGVRGRDAHGSVEITARYVVGADGLRSRIARSVGARVMHARPSIGAVHYAYFRGRWSPTEYFVGDGQFAGVFPTHDGEACVWVCNPADHAETLRRRHATIDDAFEAMIHETGPAFEGRLRQATRTSTVRGMMRLPNHYRQPVGDGWALVGDAGYHRDAVTGHGISDAFRDAELLATALTSSLTGDTDEVTALRRYHATRDAMSKEVFDITCELSQFPATDRFVELQRALGRAIDAQAADLSARPLASVSAA